MPSFEFAPETTPLKPEDIEPDTFYFGVGGIDHPQVFDHHRPGIGPDATPGALIWARREGLSTSGAKFDQIRIVCHPDPHWATGWAVTLIELLLSGHELYSERVEALNSFSAHVLSGFNPCAAPLEGSVLAVFEMLMEEAEHAGSDREDRDRRKLDAARSFFHFLYPRIRGYEDLKRGTPLADDGPYGRALLKARADYQDYLRDLARAKRFSAHVRGADNEAHRVDGLYLQRPTARLFKFWARSDSKFSSGKAGFPLLWVRWNPTCWFISVDPASGYMLAGLGDKLTAEEIKLNSGVTESPPRRHYSVADPWYDARKEANAFTIVVSPRSGTRLDSKKVKRLLKRFFKVREWKAALRRPSWFKDRFLPLWLPAIGSPILLLIVAGLLLRSHEDCAQWRDLQPLSVNQGRYLAIAIGINNYQSPGWPSLKNPVHDAKAVFDRFVHHYGFDPIGETGSRLILSGKEPAPTEANIKVIIQQVAEAMTPSDSLLIYYAGHGDMDKTYAYWVPEDGYQRADYIDKGWLHLTLKESRARHILVISDACYSGKMASDHSPIQAEMRGEIDREKRLAHVQGLFDRPSRQLLSAGFFETVADQDLANNTPHSPFAACFIENMQTHASSSRIVKFKPSSKPIKYVTGRELYEQTRRCTAQRALARKPFLGPLPSACDQQGDLVLRSGSPVGLNIVD